MVRAAGWAEPRLVDIADTRSDCFEHKMKVSGVALGVALGVAITAIHDHTPDTSHL